MFCEIKVGIKIDMTSLNMIIIRDQKLDFFVDGVSYLNLNGIGNNTYKKKTYMYSSSKSIGFQIQY